MPPYQYQHQLGGWDQFHPRIAPLQLGVALERSFLSIWNSWVMWDLLFTKIVLGLPVPIGSHNVVLNTYDPDSPPLDPGGMPYTLAITVIGVTDSVGPYFGQIWEMEPAYDKQFHIPLFDLFGNPHPDFPSPYSMTPVRFDAPVWTPPP